MEIRNSIPSDKKSNFASKRFATLDFARGLSIFIMLILHVISTCLNIDGLLENMSDISLLNVIMLIIIPFLGGMAGFFLLISATSNMISMMKHLKSNKPVKSLVFKQIFGGVILLAFAMLTEGLTGYHGAFGEFFRRLTDLSQMKWELALYKWNHFETIHTIAWCLIINGCVQGLLSLKGNWKNTKKMIITYIILAVSVVGLTQLVWFLVGLAVPGYPLGTYPSGHQLYLPWIGTESFWQIFRTPFLNALAGPVEPIFPYLAVSFIGSIIGIKLSQPKEEINDRFPRNAFLGGLAMFITGLVGVIVVIVKVINVIGFEDGLMFYKNIFRHRYWSPDVTPAAPLFAWVWQFLFLNGFALMMLMFLFRAIEFRGREKIFSEKTIFIRRFGTVAFSNYNNQGIYLYVYFFVSSILSFSISYQKQFWFGTFLIALLTILLYHLILRGWEKIKYFGSFEWCIRMINNNLVPARRARFDSSVKWWQRGRIEVDKIFYNVDWISLKRDEKIDSKITKTKDSKFALTVSLVGLCSIFFILACFISLFLSLRARTTEGRNKQNTNALRISIAGIFLFVGIIVITSILKVGLLGL